MGPDQVPLKLEEPPSRLPGPHVVLLALPAPGHTFPFIALGKVLANEGIKVTFLSTGLIPDKVRYDLGDELTAEHELMDITFRSIVEEPLLEPEHPSNLGRWMQKLSSEEMVERAAGIVNSLSPAPCCFISDVFIDWGATLEKKLEIPRHFLITMSAASTSFLFSVPQFAKQGILPMDPSGSAEFVVPGLGTIPPGDVWEYLHRSQSLIAEHIIQSMRGFTESFATATYLVNTCEEIERSTVDALKEPIPFTGEVAKVVTIGPLLPASVVQGGNRNSLDEVEKKNTRRPSSDVEEWLDAQPSGSVLYIAFGTLFTMQAEQVQEVAHALEASEQRFLWIIRPPDSPLVMISKQSFKDEITALLPPGFENRTRGRGLLVSSWIPQVKILSHTAVGLFMSHCGWNSTMEALSTATPVLACPVYSDQWMNARFIVETVKCGVKVKNEEGKYERRRIEGLIRSMMEGEEGRVVRSNVANVNRLLREAITPSTGSSHRNLQQYVKEIYALDKQSKLHSHS